MSERLFGVNAKNSKFRGESWDIEPDIKVGFILSPRFTIIAFASFIDCLRHAADEADHSRQIFCRWSIIASSLDPVEASCGVAVIPQQLFPDPASFDYIIVVGGLLPMCMDLPAVTYQYMRTARASNVSIIGLCTGSFVLANAGLLDGFRCAVHFEHRKQFSEMFPDSHPVSDQIYVEDRGMITCPGGTAPIDLAFKLIEKHCGKARAVKGIISLLVDLHRSEKHMPHRPYDSLTGCGNWRVEQAVEIMQRNLTRSFGIIELAHRLGTSLRELNRAFRKHADATPATIWRNIRLAHGHWLLVNSTRNVTPIALECGFSDGAHFSRWFKKSYGESPKVFRQNSHQTLRTVSDLEF